MPRCPKCAYILVLLPKRSKYKCAKCGGLFPQREIDDREFRKENKRQRQQDIENLKAEKAKKKPRIKLSEEERKRRAKECNNKWREKNKDKLKQYERKRDRKQYHRERYHQNTGRLRLEGRLKYWRQRQKALALQQLGNEQEKVSSHDIFISVPT